MLKQAIPTEVGFIINTLCNSGFETYIVGGCIRDLLIGKNPKDWDIITSAMPETIEKLFDKTIPTGLKYGTVTVVINDTSFEVTTFRANEVYTNHRKPDSVDFINDLDKDLERRDFTINAIAYNDEKGIIDLFGGQKDLQNKIIKTVGDANVRFEEDALRMLRAIRFSSQLDFSIDQETIFGIMNCAKLITKISIERIENELSKILMSEHPEKFILVHQTGLLKLIIPMLYSGEDIPMYDILKISLKQVSNAPYDLDIRWSILLSNILSARCSIFDVMPTLTTIMKHFKFNNNRQNAISTLVRFRNYNLTSNRYDLKALLAEIGTDAFKKIVEFFRCIKIKFDYDEVLKVYNEILKKGEPIFLSDLDVTGNDIKTIGATGEEIGELLDKLHSHCLEYPKDNQKDKLLELAKQQLKSYRNYC